MKLLEGSVGWITGASRGIGRATALETARQGASLILTARSLEALQDVAAEIEAIGGPAKLIVGDVGDSASLQSAFKQVRSHTRRLDFVVNNAGILRDAILGMISVAQMEEVIRTNAFSVIQIMQFAARMMMAQKASGSIINVASIIARTGNEGQVVYGASKAAVIGATKSAAYELAPHGIRVNAVAPGVIDTAMIAAIPAAKMEHLKSSIRMGRLGTADEVAKVICLLASDYTSYVTGQVIGVDGGMWL